MREETRRLAYLRALGIDVWVRRGVGAGADATQAGESTVIDPAESLPAADRTGEVAGSDWGMLRRMVSVCTRCALHESRTQTVFGVGSETADLMVIGEAPGAEEDRRGEPFVGRAGKLLDEMLRAIGLDRERVFIANILKCRPPGNRDPRAEESAECRPYLRRQITLIEPRVILAVGRIAAQDLLETDEPIGRLRTRSHHLAHAGVPVIVTYHPAYLLRSPGQKRKAWQDLCRAQALLTEGSP